MRSLLMPSGLASVRTGLLLAAAILALPAQANEALARKNDCLGCHAVATKLVGPAYKDVAAKYAGQADAQTLLVQNNFRSDVAGAAKHVQVRGHDPVDMGDNRMLG